MHINQLALAAALLTSKLSNVEGITKKSKQVWKNADKKGTGTMKPPQLVLSFSKINYNWDDDYVEEDYLSSGAFMTDVNVITGIKVGPGVESNPQDTNVFLTVPPFFGGVPSTLNRVKVS